jgi:cobyrinic acid a,c-diamide synthase
LGLVSPRSDDSFDALADAVEARLSIETVLSLMRPLRVSVRASEERVEPTSLRLAVAEDEAFQFVYADFRERLESMGVTWMPFSPLRDSALPEGAQALYLPGGYPEEYAEPLAANRPLWRAVRAFAVHRPIYAECGGMMVLGQSLVARNGQRYLMSRLLPFATRLGRRAARLGYVEVTLERDGFWGKKGDRCRGHEFHYSEFEEPPATECIYRLNDAKGGQRVEGLSQGRTLASYVHLHLASHMERLGDLVREWSR